MSDNLFEDSRPVNPRESKDNYTCMEEITTGVVTITHLPGGFGQKDQKLAEPIDVIKTKMIDVGDGLNRNRVAPLGENFSADMIPRKVRTCRSCDRELPEDRHWNCHKCVPRLPDELEGLEYCGVSGE